MTIPQFDDLNPGDRSLSAGWLNALAAEVERQANTTFAAPLAEEDVPTGRHVYISIGELAADLGLGHWARIDSNEGIAMGHTEVVPAAGGTWQVKDQGIVGTPAGQPLFERNDLTGCPINAVVFIYPGVIGPTGQEWQCDWGWVWAEIRAVDATGAPPVYTCEERLQDGHGGFVGKVNGRTFAVCYERNKNLVPVGSYVRLFRHVSGWLDNGYSAGLGELEFEYEPAGGGGGTVIVNTVNINTVTVKNYTWAFNQYDNSLWFYANGIWINPCICATGSLTGGDPTAACTPGTCSLCTDPPHAFTIAATGFAGLGADFNGTWKLINTAACTWSVTATAPNNRTVTVTIVATAPSTSLTFTLKNAAGTTLASATYGGIALSGNCCLPLAFTLSACSVADTTAGSSACSICTTTPEYIDLPLSGFTDCYAAFNGTWRLLPAGPCQWQPAVKPGNLTISFGIASGGAASLQLTDTVSGGVVTYSTGALGADCCTNPYTLTKDFDNCLGGGTGTAPSSVVATPTCGSTGANCPTSLTASPECCGSPPAGGTLAESCGLCDAVPAQWTVTVAGVTNGDCTACAAYNGTFTLTNPGSGCAWQTGSATACVGTVTHLWQLYYRSGDAKWVLLPEGTGVALGISYELAATSWDCLGPNTLTRVGTASSQCSGWPATLTVTPA